MNEIALPGGNVSGAVRVGDTVRRVTGAWTPQVHALLDHLAAADLPGVPAYQARWVQLMADAYDGGLTALQILEGAPLRALRSARVIKAGQDAGDPGMLNLLKNGEPRNSLTRSADLQRRIPEIAGYL